jgi:hypothetical protein
MHYLFLSKVLRTISSQFTIGKCVKFNAVLWSNVKLQGNKGNRIATNPDFGIVTQGLVNNSERIELFHAKDMLWIAVVQEYGFERAVNLPKAISRDSDTCCATTCCSANLEDSVGVVIKFNPAAAIIPAGVTFTSA